MQAVAAGDSVRCACRTGKSTGDSTDNATNPKTNSLSHGLKLAKWTLMRDNHRSGSQVCPL